MGCWLSFRGSLAIDPPISQDAIERFNKLVEASNYPQNHRARYNNNWRINAEGRLECGACKFFEHESWLKYLYDKFFEPEGYDIYGTLLYSGDGRQTEWSVLRVDNGIFFHPHIEPIMIDMDFWEMGASLYNKYREENPLPDYPYVMPTCHELKPEQYGGIFDPYDEEEKCDEQYGYGKI